MCFNQNNLRGQVVNKRPGSGARGVGGENGSCKKGGIELSVIKPGEPVSFIGITYRIIGADYLQEQKGLQDSNIMKAHPSMSDRSQIWEPGAH